MDSTTITRFKDILKGCGRLPKEGKKKGGVLKGEEIILHYGKKGALKHRSWRIACWDAETRRLFKFK